MSSLGVFYVDVLYQTAWAWGGGVTMAQNCHIFSFHIIFPTEQLLSHSIDTTTLFPPTGTLPYIINVICNNWIAVHAGMYCIQEKNTPPAPVKKTLKLSV